MATPQQYSLRWNNYFRHLTYALDNHRNNDDFVDVSLLCDGRKIKAHKVVLSACSSYFREIFTENPHPHPVIIFKFIKFEDLNSIIEFMYQGEVNVQQEALQSFLQTAELLAVQGLTSEEKSKPKPPPTTIIEDNKFIKTIPSTIRAINDTIIPATQAVTQTGTQTPNSLEINTATVLQATVQPHMQITQHVQQHQQQTSQPTQNQLMHQHHVSTQIHQMHAQQPQAQPTLITTTSTQQHPLATHVSQPSLSVQQITAHQQHHPNHQQLPTQSLQVSTHPHASLLTLAAPTMTNNIKKRKITFSDDDDNIYTAEAVDYDVKDEETIVKSGMTLLRGTIKMDLPEYIVGDEQLSDDGGTHTTNPDTTNETQNVTQYTSEYEILTESEIEDKYHGAEGDNSEISIEMGGLLDVAHTTTAHNPLDESDSGHINSLTTTKIDNKSSSTTDLPNNKWTECQFCKMVITTVNLWRHIRTQHTPQPPRKCDLCNKNFKNKYSLREHIRISHEQKVSIKSEN